MILKRRRPPPSRLIWYPVPKTEQQQVSKIDVITQRLAAWSQVAMLALVALGYFYTVRPVFQKDRLEEQVAQLELDRRNIIAQSAKARQDLARATAETSAAKQRQLKLQEQNSELQGANHNLLDEAARGRYAAATARETVNSMKTQAAAQRQQIRKNQTQLLWQRIGWVLLAKEWNRSQLEIIPFSSEPGSMDTWAKSPLLDPYSLLKEVAAGETALALVNGMPEPHDIAKQILVDLSSDIDSKRGLFTCQAVDKARWVEAYQEADASALRHVAECMERSFIKNYEPGKSVAQARALMKTDQYSLVTPSLKIGCEFRYQNAVQSAFNKKWQVIYTSCRDKLFHAESILANGNKEEVLDVTPPSDIDALLRAEDSE